jgi:taurine--2-oxoglutarate transaminase
MADNRLHVVPPCVISEDEARRGLAIIDQVLAELK